MSDPKNNSARYYRGVSTGAECSKAMTQGQDENDSFEQSFQLKRRSYTTRHEADSKAFNQSIRTKGYPQDKAITFSSTEKHSGRASNVLVSQPREIVKSFRFTTKPLEFNITITETTKNQSIPAYFAISTIFNPKQPDLILHAGSSRDGELLGVAHYRYSRHIRMGFGSECLTTNAGIWEEMRNSSTRLGHGRYEFEYSVPPSTANIVWDVGANAGRMRQRFFWERTRDESDGVRGAVEQSVGWRNYRLVEHDTGRVLAVMLVDMFTGAAYKGVLNLHNTLGGEMERVVVMTATCIMDKGERRIGHYAFGPMSDS